MTKLFRAFACVVLTAAFLTPAAPAAGSGDGLDDPPARDPALEQRLKVEQTYRTKQGDTLSRISRLLYGHASWWRRIRKFNGDLLKGTGPNDPIPRGTEIRYLAPQVGGEYVVQPNDWLIRIAAWKYGSTEKWEQLFAQNVDKISDPDLIHPGDRLSLSTDGTVLNKSTGKTLMTGNGGAGAGGKQSLSRAELLERAKREAALLEQAQSRFTEEQAKALAEARSRAGAPGSPERAPSGEPDPWSWESPYFLAGFCTGVLILLLGPLAWAWNRMTEGKFVDHPGVQPVRDDGPLAEEYEYDEYRGPMNDFNGFKKRPVEDPRVNKDLIHYSDGEVDRRPGYHSLIPRRLRKYLIRRHK